MVEYIDDMIRITAGEEAEIAAVVTGEDGESITEGVGLMIHNPDGSMLTKIPGEFIADEMTWTFTVPAETTKGLKGRYSYCICCFSESLCFRKPFYLV